MQRSRQDEVLAKKAKIAELRRQRELRQQELSNSRRSIGGLGDGSPSSFRAENREDLDKLISSLVGDDKISTPDSPSPNPRSRPVSYQSIGKLELDSSDTQSQGSAPPPPPQTLSFAPLSVVYEIKSDPPKTEVVTFSKGVQTGERWPLDRSRSRSGSESDQSTGGRPPRRKLSRRQRERDEELRQNLRREIEEELKAVQEQRFDLAVEESPQKQANFPARTLTNEELEAVTSSADFQDFLDRSTKVIERALDEEYDVLADYRHENLAGADADDAFGPSSIREIIQFYDQRWSKKRMVSDIGFSPKFPELVLASYTKNPSAPYDPDGLIQVWNMHLHDRPEYIFQATSDILTAKFSPFHPNLILGGAYSGQVLLWDTRSRSPYPVQKTPLTGLGHTHPVYSLNIVGTQNAHNIISTSTDGVVCSWSADMLSQPQEYLELTSPPQSSSSTSITPGGLPSTTTSSSAPTLYSRTEDLAPTTTAFPASDPSYFIAGTEEGTIHLCQRYDRAGAAAGVDSRFFYRGHAAPVTSLDFHRATGPVDLGDLVLSASLDWSVKLWRVRSPASSSGSTTTNDALRATASTTIPPLLDLSLTDAAYDAKWSPVKPGVFASVDGAGGVDIWDLAVDAEVPITRAIPSPRIDAGVKVPQTALNKCAWESSEGRRLAVGGLDGVVTVLEVGSDLGGAESGVRGEDWGVVKRLVGRLDGGK